MLSDDIFMDKGVVDMDIGTIANLSTAAPVGGAGYSAGGRNVGGEAAAHGQAAEHEKGKESAASVVELGSKKTLANAGYTKAQAGGANRKGLSADQVKALKEDVDKSQQNMLKMMTSVLADNQARLDGVTKFNFDGLLVDASEFALPQVATTPEEAEKAVSEGGDYSVNAVADRIFGLAEKLAGGDADKLEAMRSAVEKGFELAGMTFKEATGEEDMPEITGKTHEEIMNRFDKLLEEIRNPKPENAVIE